MRMVGVAGRNWGEHCWKESGSMLAPNAGDQLQFLLSLPGVSAIAIDLGPTSQHVCAIVTGGSAKCWGRNEAGQLGTGNIANQMSPVAVNLPFLVRTDLITPTVAAALTNSATVLMQGSSHLHVLT